MRGLLHEQARRLDVGCHIRQLHLDGLVLSDWFAKAGTLLRVADGLVESGLRHANGARGHVDAPDLQAAHGLFEALALSAAQQVRRRDTHSLEDQFRRLHALVAKFLEAAARAQPRRSLFHEEDAHAAMGGLCLHVGARQHGEDAAVDGVRDPELGAVEDVVVTLARRRHLDGLHIAAPARF